MSSWNRYLRRTAWIMRFSNRCRKRTRDPGLGFTEKIQIKDYNKGKSKRKPLKDIIIARISSEEFCSLYHEYHCSLYHAGVRTTLSELKEKFWIVKGRQQINKVWFAYVTCQKLSSPLFQELSSTATKSIEES